MEDTGIVRIPSQTVVHNAFLSLCKSGCFFVNSFDLIGVLGYRVDLEVRGQKLISQMDGQQLCWETEIFTVP